MNVLVPILAAGVAAFVAWAVSGRQIETQLLLAARQSKVVAYEHALRLCGGFRDWANRTYPVWLDPGAPEPTLPDVPDQIMARTLISLHGSESVRLAYDEVSTAMRTFIDTAHEMSDSRAAVATGREVLDLRPLWTALRDERGQLSEAIDRLASAMRADLGEAPADEPRPRRDWRRLGRRR